MGTLVVLDVAGLALGIYLALVIRQLVHGDTDILWGLLWREGPQQWLKFAAPITVLVFAQAGLYGVRERRPGPGRVLSSLIVVALIVFAFGLDPGERWRVVRWRADRNRGIGYLSPGGVRE